MISGMEARTEQESFWGGDFGDAYTRRNNSPGLISSNVALFSRVFASTRLVRSVLEFGPNVGLNLRAIGQILPGASLAGVELNRAAFDELRRSMPNAKSFHDSIHRWSIDVRRDFVFTKGLLIHLHPESLTEVYQKMYDASSRYIMVAEYYSPDPKSISYRGYQNQLFKRDFAGELLDMFPDLAVVDYGFTWHRDPNFAQDDLTWFLMEKT